MIRVSVQAMIDREVYREFKGNCAQKGLDVREALEKMMKSANEKQRRSVGTKAGLEKKNESESESKSE